MRRVLREKAGCLLVSTPHASKFSERCKWAGVPSFFPTPRFSFICPKSLSEQVLSLFSVPDISIGAGHTVLNEVQPYSHLQRLECSGSLCNDQLPWCVVWGTDHPGYFQGRAACFCSYFLYYSGTLRKSFTGEKGMHLYRKMLGIT